MAVTTINLADTISQWVTKTNTISSDLGDKALLETTDNLRFSNVVFFIDDSLFFTDTESPYQYDWNTTQYEDNSEHIVKVISYDNSDNYTTSQPISYIVDNSTSIPTLSLIHI